jgi:NADP-dependent 3-hydroxy acid dehydrogenase YdfG
MNKKNVALVTGASFGIGQALSRELISQDRIVVGLARSSEKLMAIKNELGPSFIPITCDVSPLRVYR